MFRTVSEMHVDLDFLIDKVRTPRFTALQRDRVLNFSQDRIIQDRYDNIKQTKNYSFQAQQRVRDELRPLVVSLQINTIITSNSFDLPADYRHELLLEVMINGVQETSVPIEHNELGVIFQDPYSAPTNDHPRHIESGDRRTRVYFSTGILNQVTLYYLRNPLPIIHTSGQDSELPGHLHDELLQLAAGIINGTVEDYNKYKLGIEEAQLS